VFAAMKRSLGVGQWIRRGLGLAVLAGVAAIALGLDTGFLTQVSLAGTNSVEQGLLDQLHPSGKGSNAAMNGAPTMMMNGKPAANGDNMMSMKPKALPAAEALPVEGTFPALSGAVDWLNSPPLTAASLRGKVVLVDFWTYSCINCLRALPYVKAWAQKYKDQGLVVIGVHAPEFAFEKNIDNVKKAVARLGVSYPVAIDNNYAIWRAFNNEYWPAHYFIDAQGSIRHHHFGEGDYAESERVIQQLLAEANGKPAAGGVVTVSATGAEAPADMNDVRSPETYIGYERAENFVSDGGATHDAANSYSVGSPNLNEWGLSGRWTVHGDEATLDDTNGGIVYRFHARDLHLVLGPSPDGKPIRFRVTVDGKAPGEDHGVDVDADGNGTVTGERLYQLVRQKGSVQDRTFEIRFLDPGVRAYSFTFG
jgi:thiol-disulfide isomerase/thioredoxin